MTPDGRIAEQGVPHQLFWLQKRRDRCKGTVTSALDPAAITTERICTPRRRRSIELLQQEELQQDLSHQSGDIRLYGYYLEAIGWLNAVGFAISDGIFAFCSTFPTVWLRCWSEEETDGP